MASVPLSPAERALIAALAEIVAEDYLRAQASNDGSPGELRAEPGALPVLGKAA